jgi:hypothetical protein
MMRSRCEWKALVLAPGLEVASIRAVEQLGRLFATPIASRFYKVRAETADDGSTRASSTPVETIAAANRLELVFASPEQDEAGEAAEDEEESDRLLVEIAMPPTDDSPPAAWLVLECDAERWGGVLAMADRILSWSREELAGGRMLGARFTPRGGATTPGPQPPLAADALVLCVEIASIEREYGSLDRYLAAFDYHEEFEKVVLVSRCLDSDLRLRRQRLLDSCGALARIAKPRRTLWIPTIPPPLGVALERPDRPALRLAALREPGPIAEYTCSLLPGQHVHPAEIVALQSLLGRTEALPDGRHVTGVSVVFEDDATARAEMRPLRDIGVRVLTRQSSGDAKELLD